MSYNEHRLTWKIEEYTVLDSTTLEVNLIDKLKSFFWCTEQFSVGNTLPFRGLNVVQKEVIGILVGTSWVWKQGSSDKNLDMLTWEAQWQSRLTISQMMILIAKSAQSLGGWPGLLLSLESLP